jgi:hypothetical protein
LRKTLEDIADDLMVDVSLVPAKDDDQR